MFPAWFALVLWICGAVMISSLTVFFVTFLVICMMKIMEVTFPLSQSLGMIESPGREEHAA